MQVGEERVHGEWRYIRLHHIAEFLEAAEGLACPSPFQASLWLKSWYEKLGSQAQYEPLLIKIQRIATGEVAALLPLMIEPQGRMKRITFADAGLTDYNAWMMGKGAPQDESERLNFWQGLKQNLPRADLLAFEKILMTERGQEAQILPRFYPSNLNGNIIRLGNHFEDWIASFNRHARKELNRYWKQFCANPGARFERIRDTELAQRVFKELAAQQLERIHSKNLTYILDEPANEAVYRNALLEGLQTGEVVLTALIVKEELVASLLGLRHGDHYAMVRLAIAGKEWAHCAPGRMVIVETMRHLHGEGVRLIDFTTGNYEYKRRLGVSQLPLQEMYYPLSLRALPHYIFWHAKPYLRNIRARLRGDARDGAHA